MEQQENLQSSESAEEYRKKENKEKEHFETEEDKPKPKMIIKEVQEYNVEHDDESKNNEIVVKDENKQNIEINNNTPNEINEIAIKTQVQKVKKEEEIESPWDIEKRQSNEYFSFIFYSMKLEVKSKEFFSLISLSIIGEIVTWVLKLLLHLFAKSSPFLWVQTCHVLRALFGIIIMAKMPKSYQIFDEVEGMPKSSNLPLTRNFYHLKRFTLTYINKEINGSRGNLLFYFALTFLNFVADLFDFLFNFSLFQSATEDKQIMIVASFQFISILFLGI